MADALIDLAKVYRFWRFTSFKVHFGEANTGSTFASYVCFVAGGVNVAPTDIYDLEGVAAQRVATQSVPAILDVPRSSLVGDHEWYATDSDGSAFENFPGWVHFATAKASATHNIDVMWEIEYEFKDIQDPQTIASLYLDSHVKTGKPVQTPGQSGATKTDLGSSHNNCCACGKNPSP